MNLLIYKRLIAFINEPYIIDIISWDEEEIVL